MELFGIIISSILTGIILYNVFKILKQKEINSYSEFLFSINSNKKINSVMEIMIQAFLAVSFFIMIAGFCAYFKQEFQVPTYISAIIIAIFCYFTFINDTKGIVSINTILIPALTIFIFYLGIKNIPFTVTYFEKKFDSSYSFGWLVSSILYTSYNSILLIPILIELKKYAEKNIKCIAILCSIILIILGFIIFSLLLRGNSSILTAELPMIQIVKEFGDIYSIIYGGVIIIAIFTSAISAGYGFLKNITNKKIKYRKVAILMCILSIIIAPIGFSNLVAILYPIFGILGLIQFFYIFKYVKISNKNKTIL